MCADDDAKDFMEKMRAKMKAQQAKMKKKSAGTVCSAGVTDGAIAVSAICKPTVRVVMLLSHVLHCWCSSRYVNRVSCLITMCVFVVWVHVAVAASLETSEMMKEIVQKREQESVKEIVKKKR